MIGAVVEWDGAVLWRRFIRDDVLDSLYGKASVGAKNLINTGLETLSALGPETLKSGSIPSLYGLHAGPLRHTHASTFADALRTAALLYSSLTNLDKLDDLSAEDAPTQDEGNQRFATEVRSRVIAQRPDLELNFGQSAVLIEGGERTKFGYVSPRSILHFGVLSAVRQPAGVRDARAKLWEMTRAKEYSQIPFAGLIFGVPSEEDPTLSGRQIDAMRRNIREIEQEADTYHMRFFPVASAQLGAQKVIEYA
ncbi:hypothetical protein WM40_17410 [Robbsia andropogonis]|uniref:Uncharacterized protein n=2 Tax=Robbsia andropogonis TaxID=28092 RepID=A0A0F5JX20_9BURK|nr:hypothetical protein [Robbsia andropogonis]KKB62416.1 hypothetical protein WM40_17410 [Robbsia andropogonis]